MYGYGYKFPKKVYTVDKFHTGFDVVPQRNGVSIWNHIIYGTHPSDVKVPIKKISVLWLFWRWTCLPLKRRKTKEIGKSEHLPKKFRRWHMLAGVHRPRTPARSVSLVRPVLSVSWSAGYRDRALLHQKWQSSVLLYIFWLLTFETLCATTTPSSLVELHTFY